MNLSKRDRRALVLGAVGLAAIVIVRYAAIPWMESWADAKDRIVAFSAQVDHRERAISKVLAQRGRLVKRYGSGVNRPLADVETAQADLFRATQKVLVANGFSLSDCQPRPPRRVKSIPGVDCVALQVRGGCKAAKLTRCLAAMREAPSLVFIDRIALTNDAKKPGELQVTLLLATLAERSEGGS